jgi:hypothetical protein
VQPNPDDPLRALEEAYRQHFELEPVRASVSFLGVQPLEILRYPEVAAGERRVTSYLTLGMARHPMGDPAAPAVEVNTAPRAELILTAFGSPDEVWRRLAVLAAAPAVESAVYTPGGRIDLGEPWLAGSRCVGGVLVEGPLQPVVVAGMAKVQILRIVPATSTELAWARVHGSDALTQRWRQHGTELRDLMRDPVGLD